MYVAWGWMVYVSENATGGLAWVVVWCCRPRYVLTYINDMLIHINVNSLDMSILLCNFAVEKVINKTTGEPVAKASPKGMGKYTMKKMKQHKTGECFENCKLIYEVRENESCKGCSFFIEEENYCTKMENNMREPCSDIVRNDNKSVIFVQVGEIN